MYLLGVDDLTAAATNATTKVGRANTCLDESIGQPK
jgi:hypothetical protein